MRLVRLTSEQRQRRAVIISEHVSLLDVT